MRATNKMDEIIAEMKQTLLQRIEFCRGAVQIFGKPNTFQVILNAVALESKLENDNIKNSDIKELIILSAQSAEAEKFMFQCWASIEDTNE